MRLIDADKLKALYELPESEYYNIPVPVILQNIDDMPTECRWIPVTECLPGGENDVLVTANGYTDTDRYDWNYEIWERFCDDGEVTAWMPMPKPWRKENKMKLQEYRVSVEGTEELKDTLEKINEIATELIKQIENIRSVAISIEAEPILQNEE